jgi:hypothetical protein
MLQLDASNPTIGCLQSSNGHRLHMIAIAINLQALPIFPSLAPVWIYFLYFYIYLMQGRYAGYIPTISETGSEALGHELQYKTFVHVDSTFILTCLNLFVYACAHRKSKLLRVILVLLMIWGFIGNVGIACFEMVWHSRLHQASAFFGLIFVMSFEAIIHVLLYNFTPGSRFALRTVFLVCQVPMFILAAFAESMLSDREAISWSTLGEYGFLLAMFSFMLSFDAELGDLKLVLFFAEEDNGKIE